MTVPLNQAYRPAETYAAYPGLQERVDEYDKWAALWHPRERGHGRCRAYDAGLFMHQVDVTGKQVAEFGARDSVLGPWLTRWAAHVHVSDNFKGWFWPGNVHYWMRVWQEAAWHPDRLTRHVADMRNLECFGDGTIDAAISLSAIEHVAESVDDDGDTVAAKELGRIVKPGGHIFLSAELGHGLRVRTTLYYTQEMLFKRVIEPTGCELVDEHDFQPRPVSQPGMETFSPVVFLLRKSDVADDTKCAV